MARTAAATPAKAHRSGQGIRPAGGDGFRRAGGFFQISRSPAAAKPTIKAQAAPR